MRLAMPECRSITMSEQSRTKRGKGQSVSGERKEFQIAMAKVGFVPGTQKGYLRAFDLFGGWLDRKTPTLATTQDARRMSR